MTKSALSLARMALSVARESIPAYSSKFSRKDFTQHGFDRGMLLPQPQPVR